MATFPQEFKKSLRPRITALKTELSNCMRSARELKNLISKSTPWQNYLLESLLRGNVSDQEKITAEIKRLEWLLRPNTDKRSLDIEQATAVPIPQIIEVKRNKALCPWHNDKHPSLKYNPKLNKVYCFACNRGGDAIDVAQVVWNLTFKEAVNRLTT